MFYVALDDPGALRTALSERGLTALPLGSVVATPGGTLPSLWVLHAVSPTRAVDASVLETAYASVLAEARRLGYVRYNTPQLRPCVVVSSPLLGVCRCVARW